jgi:hypothetical protein
LGGISEARGDPEDPRREGINSTMGEIVSLTELILADYKQLLQDSALFNSLLDILDRFLDAGIPQAVELTFRLRDIS